MKKAQCHSIKGRVEIRLVVREGLKESPLLSSPLPCDCHHTSLLNSALKAVAFPVLPRGGS